MTKSSTHTDAFFELLERAATLAPEERRKDVRKNVRSSSGTGTRKGKKVGTSAK